MGAPKTLDTELATETAGKIDEAQQAAMQVKSKLQQEIEESQSEWQGKVADTFREKGADIVELLDGSLVNLAEMREKLEAATNIQIQAKEDRQQQIQSAELDL